MKLKDSTFAIIAEKKDSISHKWMRENIISHPMLDRWGLKTVYIFDKGMFGGSWINTDNLTKQGYKHPIYTEYEFEALLKAEELSEICETSKLQPKNTAFGSENIAHWHLNENEPTAPKQITISYNLALEYIADRLNVDKGIIKIEMP